MLHTVRSEQGAKHEDFQNNEREEAPVPRMVEDNDKH